MVLVVQFFQKKRLNWHLQNRRKNKLSQEHVGTIHVEKQVDKNSLLQEKGNLNFSNLRLSVDYKDYEFIKPIANYLYKKISFTTERYNKNS